MMKRANVIAVILLTTAVTLAGCSKSDDEPSVAPNVPEVNNGQPNPNPFEPIDGIALSKAEHQLVNESNNFAFSLFRTMRQDKSLLLSPLSVTYALGMLNNGAAGETQRQITSTLGFGDAGTDSINAFCRKMLEGAPRLDPSTEVLIANTIFMNAGYVLKPVFAEKAKTYYEAEPQTRNFADGQTLNVINQWASDHTKQMIQQVMGEDTFNPTAVSYLLNAIYFKGQWATPFNSELTYDRPFGSTGQRKPMMQLQDTFSYTEDDGCQMLSMDYGNGSFQMTILLPRGSETVETIVPKLTGDAWQQMCRSMQKTTVVVTFPRFETKVDLSLNDALQQLGITEAFTTKAQFPDFCNVPVFISKMLQSARIIVNEEGTEAAAVTVITAETSAGPDERPIPVFCADHPFVYVISERSTGAIFFIGQYMGD